MQVPVSPPTTLVVAIDPGKVSGISQLVVSTDAFATPLSDELTVPQLFPHMGRVFDMCDREELNLVIVVEKFTISERTIKTALSLDALDINGWLKGEQLYIRSLPFYEITPAQSKRFATDDKLKALGWYERTKDGHANDANRLMLSWIMTTDWPIRDNVTAHLAQELLK